MSLQGSTRSIKGQTINMSSYEDVLKIHQTYIHQMKILTLNSELQIGNDGAPIIKKNFTTIGKTAGNNFLTTMSLNHTETIKHVKQIMQPTRETNKP